MSPVWVLVLVNAGGEPFAVVQVQRRFAPEAVQPFTGTGGVTGYSGYALTIIPDGGRRSGMSARSQALVPLKQATTWRQTEKRRNQGNTLAEYPWGRFSAV